ncbi:MAG: hypothetical protein PUB13_01135 [Lachnospiraceae bacterium]|nr:hypothetical protein [Lachnospiraceae bacterium]
MEKNSEDPRFFNRVQFETVRSEAGLNRFVMTPTKWIFTATNHFMTMS